MVLNASSEPIHFVRIGRALSLVFGERAEIVSHAGYIKSTSSRFPRPTVIRLIRYIHIPWRQAPLTLRNLAYRDLGLCQWCRKNSGSTIDHVQPRSRGGTHSWENVVLACRSCNNRKGDRLAEELGWLLRTVPALPSRKDLLTASLTVTNSRR
jgi:5-methylcytosine-specific restriction endonuclease McrA